MEKVKRLVEAGASVAGAVKDVLPHEHLGFCGQT
jgi:hypothetical protein